jgi:acetylornithine/succinyldiaminopimelate/putrescine aminotransferase
MPLGKSLGGGVPIGVALVNQKVASAVTYGDHGSTYGGNLLACRAALVFLTALEDGLMNHVVAAGKRLRNGLKALATKTDILHEVRGSGLMLGVDTTPDIADRVVETALQCGLLINRTAGTVIRLLPPLNIKDVDIDEALSRFRKALTLAGATIRTD